VKRKSDLKKRLLKLDEDKLVLLHPSTGQFHITSTGIRYVEDHQLAQPIARLIRFASVIGIGNDERLRVL
jgi:hypothetical protein